MNHELAQLESVLIRDTKGTKSSLILPWIRSLSHKNKSVDFFCKSMDWFVFDKDLLHEIVNHKE